MSSIEATTIQPEQMDRESQLYSRLFALALDKNSQGLNDEGMEVLASILGRFAAVYSETPDRDSKPFESLEDVLIRTTLTAADNLVKEWIDETTGLLKRGPFTEVVSDMLEDGVEYHLLFADLDNFKGVNDVYDHSAGDQILKEFGKILRDNVRHDSRRKAVKHADEKRSGGDRRQTTEVQIDLTSKAGVEMDEYAGRHGGDEFVLVVAADEDGANAIMRRLSGIFVVYDEADKQVYAYQPNEAGKYDFKDHPEHENLPRITMSIGSARIGSNDEGGVKSAMKIADKRMLQEKERKRTQKRQTKPVLDEQLELF